MKRNGNLHFRARSMKHITLHLH